MNTEQALPALRRLQARMHAYAHAQSLLSYDAVTGAPKLSAEGRGRTLAVLSEDSYKLLICDETGEILETLLANAQSLDERARREVEVLNERYQDTRRIPMNEYVEFSVLLNESDDTWHQAKETDDFKLFMPYLEKVVDFTKRFAGYTDPDKTPYNALLDDYEKGFDETRLNAFFGSLRTSLVPLVQAVSESSVRIRDDFLKRRYPIDGQRKLTKELLRIMGADMNRLAVGETEHPFTDSFNHNDVRITTHYIEDCVDSSLYSVVHEAGHALYDMGVDETLDYTCLSGGASMGLHESQSRFYENVIGRSEGFTRAVYPIMRNLFPAQLADVTAQELYLAVNKAQPSLIRTEADELTYPLHIMVRYELEKKLFDGSLRVRDLPEAWNTLYREYLGIQAPDDRSGVLQDSHWAGGAFGYFPSYALGSAYAAQMLCVMQGDIDVWGAVNRGDLAPVTEWLRAHVHRFGMLKKPAELIESCCGAPFDPTCYTDYLTHKFTRIYHL